MHYSLASLFALPLLAMLVLPFVAMLCGKLNTTTWRSLRAGQRRKLLRNLTFNASARTLAISSFSALRMAAPALIVGAILTVFAMHPQHAYAAHSKHALPFMAAGLMGRGKAAPTTQQMSPQQLNAMQRQAVLSSAVEMKQQIFSTTVANPLNGNIVQVPPRNVGLIKRFVVEVTATVTAVVNNLSTTDFGVANLLSNVQFNDLNNNVRVNTSGWHLKMLEAYKNRFPGLGNVSFGSVSSSVQNGIGVGATYPVVAAPPTIAAAATGTVRQVYEVPLAYSDDDLRGSIYGNVVNATMNLQLTINNNWVVRDTGDTTFAAYKSDSALNAGTTLTNVTVTVYQVYLDQLPVGKQGVVLPILDLSTVYELKGTNFTALTAAQDFPIPYANFRDFLSTCAIFNNDGSSTGRNAGTDVNYWALQSANFTNIWKVDPLLAAQDARRIIKTDIAKGAYYFSHRRKPISTTQYGNMELIINPSAAGAAGYVQIGWEDFALVNTLTSAGSLAG